MSSTLKTFPTTEDLVGFLCYMREQIPGLTPLHITIYTRLIDIQKKAGSNTAIIGVPTANTMAWCSIKSDKTYYKKLKDLERFGFLTLVKLSLNQHRASTYTLRTEKLARWLASTYPHKVISMTVPPVCLGNKHLSNSSSRKEQIHKTEPERDCLGIQHRHNI